MSDDADPTSWLSRWPLEQVPLAETWVAVHTRFGFAVAAACQLETGLIMTVSQFQQIAQGRSTLEDLLSYLEANGALTLGRLFQLLDSVCTLPSDLREALTAAVDRRNFLVHHFYRYRAELFHSPEGCKQLENELVSIQDDLTAATDLLARWLGERPIDDVLDEIRNNVEKWRHEYDAMRRAIAGKHAI